MTNQPNAKNLPELYRLIIETANEGIWMINAENKTIFANQKMADLLGCPVDEIIGKTLFEFMDADGIELANHNLSRGKSGVSEAHEFRFVTANGEDLWTQINTSPIVENGVYSGAIAMVTDITCKRKEEANSLENARLYKSLFDDSPIPIWDEDFSAIKAYLDNLKNDGINDIRTYFENNPDKVAECSALLKINNLNQAVVELNEADSKEHMIQNYSNLFNANSAEYAIRQFEAVVNRDLSCEFDAKLRTFGGNLRHVHLKWTVVRGFEDSYKRVYLTTTDVTKRIMAENALLKNANKEKEVLLKEIHHRVKNNLQIITSLLKLQTNSIEDQKVIDLFEISLHRINSMALVHELLYKSKDFSEINYGQYIQKLTLPLIESLKGLNSDLTLNIDIKDDVSLNINTSIPLGLLINEIITNSIKHGFKSDENGEIYIRLMKESDNSFTLYIGDNGKGYDPKFILDDAPSLGLQLITSLAEQLNGSVHRLFDEPGTHYRIPFKELKQNK